jgi:hypothetical protein
VYKRQGLYAPASMPAANIVNGNAVGSGAAGFDSSDSSDAFPF